MGPRVLFFGKKNLEIKNDFFLERILFIISNVTGLIKSSIDIKFAVHIGRL